MKTRANFLLTIFVALIFTNIATEAFAQTPEKGSSNNLNAPQQNQNIDIKKANNQKKQQRYNQASPEQKQKIDKRREIMKNLTPEQRNLVKQERERHRQEMKKIIGVDLLSDQLPIE